MTTLVIDPADYDDETGYLNAVPGMMDSIVEGANAPDSEFEDVPEDWINRKEVLCSRYKVYMKMESFE